jgi:metal-responsive CopG/Arc/MetJ family transcriptional regulator
MVETQVIFSLDKRLLKEFDDTLEMAGFKTRNDGLEHRSGNLLMTLKEKNRFKSSKKSKWKD